MELLQKYPNEFPSLACARTVRKVWQNFSVHGALEVERSGRPQKAVRRECEVSIKDTEMSCCDISKSLSRKGVDLSRNLVARIAKNLNVRFISNLSLSFSQMHTSKIDMHSPTPFSKISMLGKLISTT